MLKLSPKNCPASLGITEMILDYLMPRLADQLGRPQGDRVPEGSHFQNQDRVLCLEDSVQDVDFNLVINLVMVMVIKNNRLVPIVNYHIAI